MAGGFPVGARLVPIDINTLAVSGGQILTSSATNNTLGSYVELITSTSRPANWIAIHLRDTVTSTGVSVEAVNIATGAAGSETNIINNLIVTRASLSAQELGGSFYMLPCSIPAGTRIAANAQSSGVSITVRCAITTFDDSFASPSSSGVVDTYGFNSASTIGTAVDPGGTVNTKGAWSQLTSGLTYDIAGFFFALDGQAVVPGSLVVSVDYSIGVGASGSEVAILPDWQTMLTCTSSGHRDHSPPVSPFFPIPIPAGTRVAVCAQTNTVSSPSRITGMTFYGVRA